VVQRRQGVVAQEAPCSATRKAGTSPPERRAGDLREAPSWGRPLAVRCRAAWMLEEREQGTWGSKHAGLSDWGALPRSGEGPRNE
jgi:hypothetical protein